MTTQILLPTQSKTVRKKVEALPSAVIQFYDGVIMVLKKTNKKTQTISPLQKNHKTMDSACGLSGADCFRQWQDTSQLQSRSLSKQMCSKSCPAPYASWALQIQVKYSRPGFCASGFISTMNVLLVLICKGMHLWDNMVFYVILQEFWLSETFQTSNTGLVPENVATN